MYRFFFLLALLPSCGIAEELTVSLQADHELLPSVRNELQHEVETLLTASGIRLLWHLDSKTPPDAAERLAVIHLRGTCDPAAVNNTVVRSATSLGQTQVANRQVLPFADVRCNEVRQFISPELARVRPDQREQMLGRALGRVLSHELYHILLKSTSHGRAGIGRPAQTSAELVMERTGFSRADERKLADSAEMEAAEIASDR